MSWAMSDEGGTPHDGGFVELLVDFGDALRAEGLPIGSDDVMVYCAAVAELNPSDILDLYWAGRAALVTRRDHIPVYDDVFRRFFLDERNARSESAQIVMRSAASAMAALEVPAPDPGTDTTDREQEARLGLQASGAEVLRNKAFATCAPDELRALRRIMAQIRLAPPRRRTRRTSPARDGRRVHLRRMARETIRSHGEPCELFWLERRRRLRPLVLILDVSGSMSDYSRNLLQFAYSSARAAGRVEVFCFGSRLTRITPALKRRRPDDAMARAASAVFDWDGGTRIGDSLESFVRFHARRGTSRGSIVVICSDGLDRGDPAVLERSMARLRRLSHRIVWMNPHQGDASDFVPTSLGMMVSAPFVDTFWSGHTLRSLEAFAAALPELG